MEGKIYRFHKQIFYLLPLNVIANNTYNDIFHIGCFSNCKYLPFHMHAYILFYRELSLTLVNMQFSISTLNLYIPHINIMLALHTSGAKTQGLDCLWTG